MHTSGVEQMEAPEGWEIVDGRLMSEYEFENFASAKLFIDAVAILSEQEKLNPLNHIKKFEIIKGDATKTFKNYLLKNPQTIISLIFFDFDIYEPTKKILEIILFWVISRR